MFSFLNEINLRAGAQPSSIQKLFGVKPILIYNCEVRGVKPILIYNCEVRGAFLKYKSNTLFEKFQANLFNDILHHELQHNPILL